MEGVAAHAEANQLGIDPRAAGTGVLQFFEHQGAGTVGQDEAVAIPVPRTAGTGRLVVASGERASRAETTQAETAGSHFGTAGDHHVGLAIGDVASSHANAVGTGGAGGGEGVVGPLQTQVDRQEAGNHVDDRTGHEERRDAPRPLLEQGSAVVLDIGQAADTGTHGYADTLTIGVGDLQAGIANGLEAGGETVLDEQVELAGFLGGQVFLDIETLDRTTEAGGIGGQVHMLDRGDPAATGENTFPTARDIQAQRRQHAHASNDDASTRHYDFLFLISRGCADRLPE